MPGVSRCDLTNACAFYHYHCTRGYRAHRAPGIPCALFSEGAGSKSKPRAKTRGEIAELCFDGCGCLKLKSGTRLCCCDPGLRWLHPGYEFLAATAAFLSWMRRAASLKRYFCGMTPHGLFIFQCTN